MGKYDFDLELYDANPLNWIASRVTKGTRVLEFGPANGRLTRYLKEEKECLVDIVEIDQESGEEAAEYANNALLGKEKGDIEKYYWLELNEKYDFVIFADVLEHLLNPWEVLKRCKKVIKPDGKILTSVPNAAHNSIIIDLFNDRFNYNPTGLLDNTHLRFFTEESFKNMVQKDGWAIVEERASIIRVGETEIKNTYQDVPKEVFKALICRPHGNVYQYMFALSLSTEYLQGNFERIVSLDSTSYYQMEVQYDRNGVFTYEKSISCQIDPSRRSIEVDFEILKNSKKTLIYPLNCNCVLEIIKIEVCNELGEWNECSYTHNGVAVGNKLYFVKDIPEIRFDHTDCDTRLHISMNVIKYDFDDESYVELMNTLLYEQGHIRQVCEDYEKVVQQKEEELRQKEVELQQKEEELQQHRKSLQQYSVNRRGFFINRGKKEI